MERILSELVDRLTKAHGSGLVSVVLYGSAVTPDGKDRISDFNVLCVLQQVATPELAACEPVFRWWREMRNPSPLLLSREELRSSSDCFAMEFHDIKEQHRILFGEDLVAGIEIDDRFYRAQVEFELRSKLLRLRQKAGGVLSENDLLLRLMAESLSTFCVLFRHALRLNGDVPHYGKREVAESAQRHFGIDAQPFLRLIDLREGKIKAKQLQPREIFPQYLEQIRIVVDAVDRIRK